MTHFELAQTLRSQDADKCQKRRPTLTNCVISPANGVGANAATTPFIISFLRVQMKPCDHLLYFTTSVLLISTQSFTFLSF